MKTAKLVCVVALLAGSSLAFAAAPSIELVKTGTVSQITDSINLGTANYSFDVHLDTGGFKIDGLQYYIYTLPPWADAVNYTATPLTAAGSPFALGEAVGKPVANATVNGAASGTTVWFTLGDDYPASSDYNIGTYQLNTSTLGWGTYVFTFGTNTLENEPVLYMSYTNTAGETVVVSDFNTPGTFTLQILPEPGTYVLLGAGGWVLLLGRGYRRTR